jgi:hypothetical protein
MKNIAMAIQQQSAAVTALLKFQQLLTHMRHDSLTHKVQRAIVLYVAV